MDTTELQDTLYLKLYEEQNRWRDWLVGLPPQDILEHAYEYATREDILLAVEGMELSEARIHALLRLSSPLAGLYDDWLKTETDQMTDLRDTIERRADKEIKKAQERSQRKEGR